MGLIENLKIYFKKKDNNETKTVAPEGVCPNCWGKQEWEGEFYKFKKGNSGNYDNETYDNFVQGVARKLDKITAKDNAYICETCNLDFSSKH
jgi:hypothetical protein